MQHESSALKFPMNRKKKSRKTLSTQVFYDYMSGDSDVTKC